MVFSLFVLWFGILVCRVVTLNVFTFGPYCCGATSPARRPDRVGDHLYVGRGRGVRVETLWTFPSWSTR